MIEKVKKIVKELNRMQILLYVVLIIVDIYILGIVDLVGLKMDLFILINFCIISFIYYGAKGKKEKNERR